MPFWPPIQSPARTRMRVRVTSSRVDLKVFMGSILPIWAAQSTRRRPTCGSVIRRARGGFDAGCGGGREVLLLRGLEGATEDQVKRGLVIGVVGFGDAAGEAVR